MNGLVFVRRHALLVYANKNVYICISMPVCMIPEYQFILDYYVSSLHILNAVYQMFNLGPGSYSSARAIIHPIAWLSCIDVAMILISSFMQMMCAVAIAPLCHIHTHSHLTNAIIRNA